MLERYESRRLQARRLLVVAVATALLLIGQTATVDTSARASGSAPSVTLSSPVSGSLVLLGAVEIAGAATDDVAVSAVQVAVRDRVTGQWWNGTSWQTGVTWWSAETTAPGQPTTPFSATFTGASPGGLYWLSAKAVDDAGTWSSTLGRPFDVAASDSVDTTAPVLNALQPSELSVQPLGTLQVRGSGSDNVGIASAQVAVRDRVTGLWWTGNGWQTALRWHAATLSAPGQPNSDFTYVFAGSAPGGSYQAQARVIDAGRNTSPLQLRRFNASAAAGVVPTYDQTVLGPAQADMYPVDVRAVGDRYYVVDPGRYRIVAVDSATGSIVAQAGGEQGSGPGQLSAARAIASDSAGAIYLADSANNRIQVFDEQLNYLRSWGRYGTGNGQFVTVYGVAVGEGLLADGQRGEVVYTSDGGRVQKFTTAGEFIGILASGLNQPRGLSVRPGTSELFVVNARSREVLVFDAAGSLLRRIGGEGSGPGQFLGDPRGVSFTDDGSVLFVTDDGNRRVQAFDATTGGYLYEVTGLTDPRGTAVSGDRLVVCDAWDYSLKEFDLTQPSVPLVRRLFGGPAPTAGVNSPRGLTLDGAGRLYVSDWWNQRVVRTDPGTDEAIAWGRRGTRLDLGALNFAWDVALQPGTGRVFVANRESHEIEVFEADGTPVVGWGSRGTANDPTGDFQFPSAVAFGPDGTLWVVDSENYRVQQFAIDDSGRGTRLASFGRRGTGPGGLSNPTGLAVAPDGAVWIADAGNGNLQRLTPADGSWLVIGNPGLNRFSPRGVTVAADGSIWVTEAAGQRLLKLTAQGGLVFAVTGEDMGTDAFFEPFDVAVNAVGEVFVSDLWHNRVVRLRN